MLKDQCKAMGRSFCASQAEEEYFASNFLYLFLHWCTHWKCGPECVRVRWDLTVQLEGEWAFSNEGLLLTLRPPGSHTVISVAKNAIQDSSPAGRVQLSLTRALSKGSYKLILYNKMKRHGSFPLVSSLQQGKHRFLYKHCKCIDYMYR